LIGRSVLMLGHCSGIACYGGWSRAIADTTDRQATVFCGCAGVSLSALLLLHLAAATCG